MALAGCPDDGGGAAPAGGHVGRPAGGDGGGRGAPGDDGAPAAGGSGGAQDAEDPGDVEVPDAGPACGPGAAEPVCLRGICEAGACVEPTTCDRLADCLDDRICVAGRCADPCVTHGDCGPGRQCTDGVCGPPPELECGPERPCPGRRVCHAALSVCTEPPACEDEGDCDVTRWGPRSCDRRTGLCRYCAASLDCPEGRTCVHNAHAGEAICEEPPRCTGHGDCLSGRRCDVTTGRCVFEGSCVDDGREPNDSWAQAADNPRSHLAEARYTRLSICPGTEDWYRVRVPPGRSLQATLRHMAPFDELDLAIRDDRGAPLVRGAGPPNAERAGLPGHLPGGGFRYVQVTSRRGGPNDYTLEIDLPECVDDGAEPNDGAEEAVPLRDDAVDAWICGPDVDWWRLEALGGSEVAVDLVHGGAPEDLRVLFTAEPGVAGAAERGQAAAGGATLRTRSAEPGPRWIAVEGGAGVRAAYRLEVAMPPEGCEDDAREGNDGRLTPSPLSDGANRLLVACPGDPDWHSIALEQGDGVRVRVAADPADAVDAALVLPTSGADPPAVVARLAPADGELLLGRTPRAGRILVRVVATRRAEYRLDVTRVPGGFCTNDPFEANDEVGQEAEIPPGEHDAMLCPGDKDRFALPLEEGSILDVGVTYEAAAGGGVSLAVFDPEGRLLGESAEGEGRETVRGLARQSGAYVVRVGRQGGDAEIPYRLTAYIEPVNDRCDHPVDLHDGAREQGALARARDDLRGSCGGSGPDLVYRLQVDRPSGLEAVVTPQGGAFPAALHLRSDCHEPDTEVACERDADREGAVRLRVPYLRGGDWFLIVDSVDRERGGNFSLDVRLQPGGICFADEREPDDRPEDAGVAEEGRLEGLSLCPDDADWFAVDVPVGHDLVVGVRPRGDAGDIEVAIWDRDQLVAGPVTAPGELRARLGAPGPRLVSIRGGPGDYAVDVAFVDHGAPEDSCDDPPPLLPDVRVMGDTRALHDFARSPGCGNPAEGLSEAPEAVYRIDLPVRSSIKATVTGDFDRVAYLRQACAVAASELACVDDWIEPPEVLQHPHLDAGTYYLFVDGYDDASGPYEVSLKVGPPYFPPENDTCATATELPPGRVLRGTTRLAEDDYASSCTRRRGHAAPDVVYRFALRALTHVRLTLDQDREGGVGEDGEAEGHFDSVLYLRRDCRNDTGPVACIDEPEPQTIDAFLGEGEYFVFVDGWREGEGDFRILLETSDPP